MQDNKSNINLWKQQNGKLYIGPNPISPNSTKAQKAYLLSHASQITIQIHIKFQMKTWNRIVRRASGAVQVLLNAPAIPPARSWFIVPIWDCWFCCKNFLPLPSPTTLPWALEFKALCLASTTIFPTRASIFSETLITLKSQSLIVICETWRSWDIWEGWEKKRKPLDSE